jgi:Putative mono-oxygenase ydhR
MPTILQIDFPYDGPFGSDLSESRVAIAEDIAGEPGLLWKIWTENADTKEAGGVYLFEDEKSAEAFREKQTGRLRAMGMANIRAKIFAVNGPLTEITRGPVAQSPTIAKSAAE